MIKEYHINEVLNRQNRKKINRFKIQNRWGKSEKYSQFS